MVDNDVKNDTTSAADNLTHKQKVWADEYIANGGIAADAAKKAYPGTTYGSQKTMGANNQYNKNIQAYLDEKGMDAGLFLEKVMNNRVGGEDDVKMPERLKAAIFIYEQSIGKARQRVEITGKDGDAIETVNLSGLNAMELDKIRKEILGAK